jgi:hypothetical protein
VNWSSLLLQGLVNFVIPCALYYKALMKYPLPASGHNVEGKHKKTKKKKKILTPEDENKRLSGKHVHLQEDSFDEESDEEASEDKHEDQEEECKHDHSKSQETVAIRSGSV